jgi:hypothetical protein
VWLVGKGTQVTVVAKQLCPSGKREKSSGAGRAQGR